MLAACLQVLVTVATHETPSMRMVGLSHVSTRPHYGGQTTHQHCPSPEERCSTLCPSRHAWPDAPQRGLKVSTRQMDLPMPMRGGKMSYTHWPPPLFPEPWTWAPQRSVEREQQWLQQRARRVLQRAYCVMGIMVCWKRVQNQRVGHVLTSWLFVGCRCRPSPELE